MLLLHTFAYLFARGGPALMNFAALLVYTRLLDPRDYGEYALVTAGVTMVGVTAFQWLRLVAARWFPGSGDAARIWLGQSLSLFLLLAAGCIGAGLLTASILPWSPWGKFVAFGGFLLAAQQWLELNLKLTTMQLAPGRYAKLLGSKSALALVFGALLAWLGLGAWGPLIGLLLASLLVVPLFGGDLWKGVRLRNPIHAQLPAQLRYGLPLIATFALGWIIASSDRLLIGWLMGVDAAGLYAVGYDLAQQSLGVVLLVVQIASYPLAVRAMEHEGSAAAQRQLQLNGDLVMVLALGSAAGLAVLAPQIAGLLGERFRDTTALLLPYVAIAAAVGGIKTFHFDMAFHLDSRSSPLVFSALVASILNIALNLLWIPRYGLLGAAWATIAALLVGALISAYQGRNLPHMPTPWRSLLCGLLCGGAVLAGAAVGSRMMGTEVARLIVGTALGGLAGAAAAWFLDVAGCRRNLPWAQFVRRPTNQG
jgi:O-antigen/teichoic acid export membrane protein